MCRQILISYIQCNHSSYVVPGGGRCPRAHREGRGLGFPCSAPTTVNRNALHLPGKCMRCVTPTEAAQVQQRALEAAHRSTQQIALNAFDSYPGYSQFRAVGAPVFAAPAMNNASVSPSPTPQPQPQPQQQQPGQQQPTGNFNAMQYVPGQGNPSQVTVNQHLRNEPYGGRAAPGQPVRMQNTFYVDGQPQGQHAPGDGTGMFRAGADGYIYYLVNGRWVRRGQ